jgi:CRP/FNR family nitrogen fixation transcriptional regulator
MARATLPQRTTSPIVRIGFPDLSAELMNVPLIPGSALPAQDCEAAKRAVLALRRGPIRYRPNETIFCDGELQEYVYLVVSGMVRCLRVTEDGHRRIIAFCFPGDFFGLRGHDEHDVACEAVTEALVLLLKRSSLYALASRDSRIANLLLAASTQESERLQEHFFSITKSARSRLAMFLLDFARRAPDGRTIDLPMPRQDIADYLNLTIETVCRLLTELERDSVIIKTGRDVVVRNYRALQQIAK